MIKKTIAYQDIDGKEVTEDFYFNLNKGELAEWMMTFPGEDFKSHLERIRDSEDPKQILPLFKEIIARSVGQRTESNRFMKDPQFTAEFMSSDAFSEMFIGFLQNAEEFVEFCQGLVPAAMARSIQNVELPEPKQYTVEELVAMDEDEFYRVAGDDSKKWSKDQMLAAFQRRNRQAA